MKQPKQVELPKEIGKEVKKLIKKEGDYKAFEYNGYKCRILRPHQLSGGGKLIFLCGYVLLPEGHKYFQKHYDDIDVDVHGGLTFASKSLFAQPEEGWWIGFDCGHLGDVCYNDDNLLFPGDTYKDMNYVEQEIKRLVDQL